MKKALALVMAIAMVASMAAVSFAAVSFVNDEKEEVVVDALHSFYAETYALNASSNLVETTKFAYGKTVYLQALTLDENGTRVNVTNSKAVSNLTIKDEWSEGSEYVESVEFVKKKVADLGKYVYLLAIDTVETSETKTKDVIGTIYLKGKSGTDKENVNYKVDGYVDVDFQLGYTEVNLDDAAANEIGALTLYKALADDTYDFEFGPFSASVKMRKDDKVLVECDDDVIAEVEEAYPDANIDYYACTGSFKKTATVVVELEEGEQFLYAVVDGEVVEVNGEYDDWAEEFTFKTKKLGTYIISDVELEVGGDVVATNPSTGAAA